MNLKSNEIFLVLNHEKKGTLQVEETHFTCLVPKSVPNQYGFSALKNGVEHIEDPAYNGVGTVYILGLRPKIRH